MSLIAAEGYRSIVPSAETRELKKTTNDIQAARSELKGLNVQLEAVKKQRNRLAEQSRDLANKSLVRAGEVIDNLSSRGSYPTMQAMVGGGSIVFVVEVIGDFPLRGVSMRLKEITDLPLGAQMGPSDLKDALSAGRIELSWPDGSVLHKEVNPVIATIPEGENWAEPRRFVLDLVSEGGSFHVLATLTRSEDGWYSGECVTTRRDSKKPKNEREQHTHELAPNWAGPT